MTNFPNIFGKKAKQEETKYFCDPPPFYIPDKILGYRGQPGKLHVTIKKKIKSDFNKMTFNVTIAADGSRKTKNKNSPARQKIYIFGDSWLFGWGNEDEKTCGFLLQKMLPEYDVKNFAFNGYSNIHSYLQLDTLEKNDDLPDIALIGYGDYYDSRNCADAEWMKAWGSVHHSKDYMEKEPEFFLPFGDITNGKFLLEKTPLFFFDKKKFYNRNISQEIKNEINKSIFFLIESRFPITKKYVLYLRGNDKNETLKKLPPKISVIDLRPDPKKNEWDDFSPLDDHPANIAQETFAKKILNALKNDFERQ